MPKTVVCITTCNRLRLLHRLLDAIRDIRRIPAGNSVAIVVVDNRPDGRARALVGGMAPSYPLPLYFLEEPEPGISQARNRAVAWAMDHGTDFIAFLDDDDVPEPDWLGHMLRRQTATKADIVIGAFRSIFPPGTPQWLMEDPDYASGCLDLSRRFLGRPSGSSTCICLVGAPLLGRMGEAGYYFDNFFGLIGGVDADFFTRAARLGAVFAAADDALLNRYFTPDRVTTVGWMRRKFRVGVALTHVLRKYGTEQEINDHYHRSKANILRIVYRLPRVIRPNKFQRKLAALCSNMGHVYAHLGGSYRYYRTMRDDAGTLALQKQ